MRLIPGPVDLVVAATAVKDGLAGAVDGVGDALLDPGRSVARPGRRHDP